MHSPNFKDMTGMRFSRLLVKSEACKTKYNNSAWNCQCDCGNEIIVPGPYLRQGDTKSCGCLKRDTSKNRNTTHGLSQTDEFKTLARIKTRCFNRNSKDYPNYGGRGITICSEWINSPETFVRDVGLKPSKKHSLDRINVNGNYEPGNVRWATPFQQANNNRRNRVIEWNGETKTLAQWSIVLGISSSCLSARLNKGGWPIERAFTEGIV